MLSLGEEVVLYAAQLTTATNQKGKGTFHS